MFSNLQTQGTNQKDIHANILQYQGYLTCTKVDTLDTKLITTSRDVRTRMFENFTYGIYRTRSPYVENECRRRCRYGVLMLVERVVRKPIHTRATAQSCSQSSMILSLQDHHVGLALAPCGRSVQACCKTNKLVYTLFTAHSTT